MLRRLSLTGFVAGDRLQLLRMEEYLEIISTSGDHEFDTGTLNSAAKPASERQRVH